MSAFIETRAHQVEKPARGILFALIRKSWVAASLRISFGLLLLVMLNGALAAQEPASSGVTASQPPQRGSGPVRAEQGMVATVQPLATDAGVRVLQDGGNAIDAAIAAALTLGVVDNYNSGIGGGCFILIRTAEGKLLAIDGREMAPAAAHRDLYRRDGEARPALSRTGPLAVGIPGALAAYDEALRAAGTRSLSELLRPAAKLAEDGFEINAPYAGALRRTADQLRQFPGSAAALLKPDGSLYREGERLRQPDLARTYRQVAKQGLSWFYGGPFAQQVATWMEANGGIITREDFLNYQVRRRTPVQTTYRDCTIVGFPPPSSGGVHVAQVLNILEGFDLQQLHADNPATMVHVISEAMKLAFADRAYWLGDADFVDVPRGLVDKSYAARLAEQIRLDQTIVVTSHGQPPRADDDFFERHTTHLTAADAAGNWVAITQTVNTTFGSKVIVPGTGVVLNNEMDDFSIAPGVRNAFGLVGAEANAVEAGKRPLSSMSPTIVLRDGEPMLTVGAAGGPKIITQVILALINYIDLEMPLDEALAQPRFHHQWSPDRLLVEESMPREIQDRLESLGHELTRSSVVGISQAIAKDQDEFVGVHDPRIPGKAAGH